MDLHKKILTLIVTFVVLIFVECEHNEQTASLCNNCQQNNMCNNTESCAVDCKTESKEIDGKCVGKCTENCVQCEEEWCLSCSAGYFGLSCQERCQGTCSDQGCDRKTGRCFSGTSLPVSQNCFGNRFNLHQFTAIYTDLVQFLGLLVFL